MISAALAFFACLALTAFFSGAEMAFVSSNRVRLREMADSGNAAAVKVRNLHRASQQFLTVILVGNNIAQVIAIAVLTALLERRFGIRSEWLTTAVMAPLLIILGETVPKDYCRVRSQTFLLKYSGILELLLRIFRLPAAAVLKAVDFVMGTFGDEPHGSIFVSEKEFRLLIEEGARSGVLHHHEKKMIDTILDFERITVRQVMTPVEKAAKVEISQTVGAVKQSARASGALLFLVYEEIPSIIVGMIYVFDLLFEERDDLGFKNFLRSPTFLPQNTSIEKAFLTLQGRRQSFAAVTDPKGEVIGVVSIEKLFL